MAHLNLKWENLAVVLPKFWCKLSLRVKTLSITNLVASRYRPFALRGHVTYPFL